MSIAYAWNTTLEERARAYACDGVLSGGATALFRAITIEAPTQVVFRWLCQLRAAPYSYDWIDNFGRQSPQQLTPGLERLVVGQRVMRVFDLISFGTGLQVTIRLRPQRVWRRLFGDVVVTYAIMPAGASTRLVAKVVVRNPSPPIGCLMKFVLPWGDLVMMRKQFLNLKRLAERDARMADSAA